MIPASVDLLCLFSNLISLQGFPGGLTGLRASLPLLGEGVVSRLFRILCLHGCAWMYFVGGGSSWHFRLQALSWEAVSALQLVPSIRKAAHRED